MSKPTHFAESKPVVVLLDKPDDGLRALQDENGKTMVFDNLSKAQKFVSHNVEHDLWIYIQFVNEKPVFGGGDREETHNKRCLKCKSFLRPSGNTSQMNVDGIGGMVLETLDCPVCDLGEKPDQKLH